MISSFTAQETAKANESIESQLNARIVCRVSYMVERFPR